MSKVELVSCRMFVDMLETSLLLNEAIVSVKRKNKRSSGHKEVIYEILEVLTSRVPEITSIMSYSILDL
jgi:hypothetical protein